MTTVVFNLYSTDHTLASFPYNKPSLLAKRMAFVAACATIDGDEVNLDAASNVLRAILTNSGFGEATIAASVDLFLIETQSLVDFPHWMDGRRPEVLVPCREAALERFPAEDAEPEAAPF